MIAFFDVRTAFLIVGFLYLLLPAIVWIVLVEQHTLQVALWCGGGLLMGVSMILAGITASSIQKWPYVILSALLIMLSNFARIQSLRLDLLIPWRLRWIVLAMMAISMIFLSLHFGLQNYVLRGQFFFTVMAGLTLQGATLAWRIGRTEQSRSAFWIAGIFMLLASAMLFRVFALVGTSGDAIVVNEGLSAHLLAIASLLSCIVGHFGYVGLALDRSMRRELKAAAERARAEENQRLGEQIAQLDRQRALGELSASLGHELNQPLTAILTNAQVAQRGLQTGHFDTPQLTEFLDKIIYNTQRADKIIERIRDYIRPAASRRETVNFRLLVIEVAELIGDEARSHQVSFAFSPSAGPVLVHGDPILLSQIILNVFRNAIEALSQEARREIHVSCINADGRAILKIRDTGPGITPETLAQIGTPFFTTKSKGLGMGISISRSIAEQHGGTLNVDNADRKEGGGTIIELNLPALPEVKP